ncbi:MAG: signal peptide peptidase SppA [Bacteroidia bacterium]
MGFFKTFLAALLAVLAVLVALVLFVIIGIGMIAGAAGSSQQKTVISSNSILHLNFSEMIVENYPSKDDMPFDFGEISPFASNVSKVGLYQMVKAIEKAKSDDKIRGMYISPGLTGVQTGWATLQTIRGAIEDFKSSGKFVYAYAEMYDEKAYYLASAADGVYAPSSGMMEFNGFAATPMYYKGMMEKLELEPVVFKVGTHKSAVEPYLRKDMSENNREQLSELLGTFWDEYATTIAEARGKTRAEIDALATNLVFPYGDQAQAAGLLDENKHEADVHALLREKLEIGEKAKIKFTKLKKYISTLGADGDYSSDRIAVVFAEGDIVSGKSQDGQMGSETIVKALRKAREDSKVKAVVLRVNSRGGSALASDMMADEVKRTSAVKPVIVSMGDYAASGGYYIAAYGDKIFAQTNTLTGSIGIFGLSAYVGDMMEDKLGITFDQMETHENATFADPRFRMSEAEVVFRQRMIEKGYSTFVNVVADGRETLADSAAVDKVGQGRVWTGEKAKSLGLVDEIGGLDAAIAAAAEAANLTDYRTKLLPTIKTPFEKIMEDLSGATQLSAENIEIPVIGNEVRELARVQRMLKGNGVLAFLPYELDIK